MNPQTKEQIESDIKSNKVVLYMKGTPEAPQCGFSSQAANVLSTLNVDFFSRDVLVDEDLRQGIKEFSDWPTIPQLYVNGEFVGGCDIMMEMYSNGELAKLFEASTT